jgi:hypothetical protein
MTNSAAWIVGIVAQCSHAVTPHALGVTGSLLIMESWPRALNAPDGWPSLLQCAPSENNCVANDQAASEHANGMTLAGCQAGNHASLGSIILDGGYHNRYDTGIIRWLS